MILEKCAPIPNFQFSNCVFNFKISDLQASKASKQASISVEKYFAGKNPYLAPLCKPTKRIFQKIALQSAVHVRRIFGRESSSSGLTVALKATLPDVRQEPNSCRLL